MRVKFRLGSFNGGYRGSLALSRRPPFMAGDVHSATYAGDDLVIGDGMLGRVYRITHDYKIKWEIPARGPEAVEYNPDLDTILVYAKGRVLEVNALDGKITHELTSLKGKGALQGVPPYAVISYEAIDPSTFYLPVGGSVCRANWNGDVLYEYKGLLRAGSASLFAGSSYIFAGRPENEYGADANLLIADLNGNEVRSVEWLNNDLIKFRFPFPAPWARWLSNRMFAIGSGYALGYALGITYVFSFNQLKYYFPTQSNPVASSGQDPDLMFLSWDWGGFEVDLKEWDNFVEPRNLGIWGKRPLKQGEEITSPPIPAWGFDEVQVAVRSTGRTDIKVEEASFSYSSPVLINTTSWDGGWMEVEGGEVNGNKVFSMSGVGSAYRIRATAKEDASVDLWVNLKRKCAIPAWCISNEERKSNTFSVARV